jgi:hypothetical protein
MDVPRSPPRSGESPLCGGFSHREDDIGVMEEAIPPSPLIRPAIGTNRRFVLILEYLFHIFFVDVKQRIVQPTPSAEPANARESTGILFVFRQAREKAWYVRSLFGILVPGPHLKRRHRSKGSPTCQPPNRPAISTR